MGHARIGGLQLAQLDRASAMKADGGVQILVVYKTQSRVRHPHDSGLILPGEPRRQAPEVRKTEGVDRNPHVEAATSNGSQGRR